ncbi:MAG: hypothetical protein IT426_12530 [Pirellulales bacterium]|nr:hypothetical protein [Pirellulales bacterium]
MGAFSVFPTPGEFSSQRGNSTKQSARFGGKPRNSTTFFAAAAGDLPFGKDYGLRKECACVFNATNNPKSPVAALVATADFPPMPPSRKTSRFFGIEVSGKSIKIGFRFSRHALGFPPRATRHDVYRKRSAMKLTGIIHKHCRCGILPHLGKSGKMPLLQIAFMNNAG